MALFRARTIARHALARVGLQRIPREQQYDSSYLDWLSFANAGMLIRGQRALLDTAIRQMPDEGAVIEIGSFCGLSTNTIVYFLDRHQRSNQFFAVDPWEFEHAGEHLPESTISFDVYRELVRDQFQRNVRFWSGDRLPHAIESNSDDFFAAWDAGETRADVFGRKSQLGGPVAFCFIDGAHTYEQTRRDFDNASRHLVSGGLILFDDSSEGGSFPDVTRVVHEALAEGFSLVGKNPHHLVRR